MLGSGYLKKYFKGVLAKKLSAVETAPQISNQHEFNATSKMKEIFGTEDKKFKAVFLHVDDEQSFSESGFITWYDARRNHPTRTEYRLYYPSTSISASAVAGDSLFICLKQDDTILCIIADKAATITSQLYWLFDLNQEQAERFQQNDELKVDFGNLGFVARTVLNQIDVEFDEFSELDDNDLLSEVNSRFGSKFPKTSDFSDFARSLVSNTDPITDPDGALVEWFGMEEKIFFLLEKQIISERLKSGFISGGEVNVNDFIQFSLSVQNRRKSRAGLSLENHICALLDANDIRYSHTPVTENKAKPDFLFPHIKYYRDNNFPAEYLTMLGAKSTCKDRWRQVLSEAERIERKHLLTLEAAISTFQTDEMIDKKLQLVVPVAIQKTYTEKQQRWLYSVSDFLAEVKEKQEIMRNTTLIVG